MQNLLIGLFLGILLGLAAPPFYKWIVAVVTKKNNAAAVLLFLLLSVGLMSCGSTTGDPFRDNITFGQAWGHVIGFTSYWVWFGLSFIPGIAYVMYLSGFGPFKSLNPDKDVDANSFIVFICVALIAAALLIPPAECAANTTIEQASRGVFIR